MLHASDCIGMLLLLQDWRALVNGVFRVHLRLVVREHVLVDTHLVLRLHLFDRCNEWTRLVAYATVLFAHVARQLGLAADDLVGANF